MKNWGMFGALGLIWGSSFLLIKLAVAPEGADPALVGLFEPISLATIRLSIAALSFMLLLAVTRRKVPTDAPTIGKLMVAGLFNYAVPYMLITWGERSIDSGLASVLNATVPLFSLVIAHFALHDDRISLGKVFGLISGFCGVILLSTRSIDPTHANSLAGQLAVVGASLSYGVAAVFMRRTLRGLEALTTAGVSVMFGAAIMLALLLIGVRPLPVLTAMQPVALAAIVTLGLLNTFIAYILYFTLLAAWGASRTTLVTYISPPIALLLGTLINHELLDWRLLVGGGLIVGGVALANLWRGSAAAAATPAAHGAAAGD